MTTKEHQVVKKTLLLDPDKLAKLRKLFEAESESSAVRQAIDEALAYRDALQATRRIQRRGRFART